jgi:FkbM family methyltransferase
MIFDFIARIVGLVTRRNNRVLNFWRKIYPAGVFVDVGASYFYNQNWRIATALPSSTMVQIEPNQQNLSYVDEESIAAKVRKLAIALSKDGGERTLYVTNVESGSTMLRPRISPDFEPRVHDDLFSYLYPIQELLVQTSTLKDVLTGEELEQPLVLKLDVQGSEHEILKGSSELLLNGHVVAIEVEASLLRHPIGEGATKFSELQIFLEEFGFELIALNLIYSHGSKTPRDFEKAGYLNECDALFVLNHKNLSQMAFRYRMCVFFTLCMYGQVRDALRLLDSDLELQKVVYRQVKSRKSLKKILSLHRYSAW